jgi:hypothetical protein
VSHVPCKMDTAVTGVSQDVLPVHEDLGRNLYPTLSRARFAELRALSPASPLDPAARRWSGQHPDWKWYEADPARYTDAPSNENSLHPGIGIQVAVGVSFGRLRDKTLAFP